jgi:hypothetical protein
MTDRGESSTQSHVKPVMGRAYLKNGSASSLTKKVSPQSLKCMSASDEHKHKPTKRNLQTTAREAFS